MPKHDPFAALVAKVAKKAQQKLEQQKKTEVSKDETKQDKELIQAIETSK